MSAPSSHKVNGRGRRCAVPRLPLAAAGLGCGQPPSASAKQDPILVSSPEATNSEVDECLDSESEEELEGSLLPAVLADMELFVTQSRERVSLITQQASQLADVSDMGDRGGREMVHSEDSWRNCTGDSETRNSEHTSTVTLVRRHITIDSLIVAMLLRYIGSQTS